MSTTKIGDRVIGHGEPIYIMADLGLTNGGDISRAFDLIDIAADCKVDAVKFQMIDSDKLLGDREVEYSYPTLDKGTITENMHTMFKGLEFNDSDWSKIKSKADSRSVDIIITSHFEDAVDRINTLDLKVNKICTWSMNHLRMIESLAKNGKPLMFDTGTITKQNLIDLDKVYRDAGGGDLIILHDFHTENLEEMNFRATEVYRDLGHVYGYTPQGRKDWLDYMSIGLGVKILEKRLTTSRNIPENGHWKAHEPDEFKLWIDQVKMCEAALGSNVIHPTQDDLASAKVFYKSAYLRRDVEAGDLIEEEDVEFMRPGTGIGSWQFTQTLIGQRYLSSQKRGEMLRKN